MILSDYQLEKLTINEINSYKHLVLNVEHLPYKEDTEIIGYAIETLNLINTINWINKVYESSKSNLKIETKIFYKAIEFILNQKPFSDIQLKEYYAVMQNVEVFYSTMIKFKEIDIYIPYEAEFILLGLNYDEQESLGKREKENLHEYYGNFYCDVRFKNLSIEEFIIKAKDLVENCREKS